MKIKKNYCALLKYNTSEPVGCANLGLFSVGFVILFSAFSQITFHYQLWKLIPYFYSLCNVFLKNDH